jgi:[ribosomal protein S18]-alanine N-acetyltransferase
MKIARLKSNDIPDVLSTAEECKLCIWSAEAYRSELARDDSIMLRASDPGGQFVGFAVGRVFDLGGGRKSVELTNIGVRQAFRNQGFGSLLLRSFLNHCRATGVDSVVLEVRESNASAIRFYERFGFARAGRRKGFYSDPREDGLTMRLNFRSYEVHT